MGDDLTSAVMLHHPGTQTWLVDAGRHRSRGRGFPVAGAADRMAHQWANALVGNSPAAPALEVWAAGLRLSVTVPSVCSIVGDINAHIDGQPVPIATTFLLLPEQTLTVRAARRPVAYLAIAGDFCVPMIDGSVTGLEPLTAGPLQFVPRPAYVGRALNIDALALITGPSAEALRVVVGPQTGFSLDAFIGSVFRCGPLLSRMGVRLIGPVPAGPTHERLSEAALPGAVQVTRDSLVILGVDAPTVGGYPKIACVIDADLDRLAHLTPGAAVRFKVVSLDEAEHLGREARWWRRVTAAWLGLPP